MSPAPPGDERARAKLTDEWDVRGIDVATLVTDKRGTIIGNPAPERATVPRGAGLTGLPEFLTGDGGVRDLEIGDTIGEGGMGIVWAGTQTPLRREVAIKSVHPKAANEANTRALLREARVTGTLEHPNVVPIHALGKDQDGKPLIVMKRIEGNSWAELLEDQSSHGPGGVMRQLEHHLHVLIDVAKAVNFAHCRNIVHRDIKPDNVMIGAFGEVYVVDWGIAVSTDPNNELDLPVASKIREVTGSPGYMAPEMACGDGEAIDARTDVYLLGATLFQILTGSPPHEAATTEMMLTKAYASSPYHFDASVPTALATICQTAMNREPAGRYHTAAAFAAALQRYLEYRDSTLLTEEASAKLDALRDAVAVAGGDPDKRALYHLFNECRFGFLYALRIWESNTRARELLQIAIELMIGFELDHGSPGAASALLGDLPIAQPKLAARVEQSRAREQHQSHELASLKRRVDATGADQPRAYLGFLVTFAWAGIHAILWWVDTRSLYAIGHVELAASYALFAVATLAVGIAGRETFFAASRFGAQTQITIVLCHTALSLSWLMCRWLDVPLSVGFSFAFFFGAVLWTIGAVAVDRRMLTFSITMIAGLGLLAAFPDPGGIVWMGVAGAVGAAMMSWLRMRTQSERDSMPLSQQWSRADVERLPATRSMNDTKR